MRFDFVVERPHACTPLGIRIRADYGSTEAVVALAIIPRGIIDAQNLSYQKEGCPWRALRAVGSIARFASGGFLHIYY